MKGVEKCTCPEGYSGKLCETAPPVPVSCGDHEASSCTECNGESGCKGDCSWIDDECITTPEPCYEPYETRKGAVCEPTAGWPNPRHDPCNHKDEWAGFVQYKTAPWVNAGYN